MDKNALRQLGMIRSVYIIILLVIMLFIMDGVAGCNNFNHATRSEYRVYAFGVDLWGGLVLASGTLAVKKGRELLEGAVLGAFGPLGFIVEVLLPPIKNNSSDAQDPKTG
jgi:uncharacterized membrane protein